MWLGLDLSKEQCGRRILSRFAWRFRGRVYIGQSDVARQSCQEELAMEKCREVITVFDSRDSITGFAIWSVTSGVRLGFQIGEFLTRKAS